MNDTILAALGNGREWNRLIEGQTAYISFTSEIFKEVHRIVDETSRLSGRLALEGYTREGARQVLSEIWGQPVGDDVTVFMPFNTDFGRHTVVGHNVFINKDAMFVDLGGITIEDDVLIGPRVSLITVNHNLAPDRRADVEGSPIVIKRNAWLGANVTVLPGVTIGENAVVGANSVVIKDVPPNAVVVGTPAKAVKYVTD